MLVETCQVLWHDKQPVFSCDFDPSTNNVVATAGADHVIRIWRLTVLTENSDDVLTLLLSSTFPSNDYNVDGNLGNSRHENNVRNICKREKKKNGGKGSLFTSKVKVEYLAGLNKHGRAVNCVRYKPGADGQVIASAGDGGLIIVWKRKLEAEPDQSLQAQLFGNDNQEAHDEQQNRSSDQPQSNLEDITIGGDDLPQQQKWAIYQIFRLGDVEDVFDLTWSPDGRFLLAGTSENSAHIYDTLTGKLVRSFKDHRHYVQGVTWDPLGQFMATQSCDRAVRVWKITEKGNTGIGLGPTLATTTSGGGTPKQAAIKKLHFSLQAKISKDGTRVTEESSNNSDITTPPASTATTLLFADESLVTFFRRLQWTPDGSFLIIPAAVAGGQIVITDSTSTSEPILLLDRSTISNTNHMGPTSTPSSQLSGFVMVTRDGIATTPANGIIDDRGHILPILGTFNPSKHPPITVRCCPFTFRLDPLKENISGLPYRHLFALCSRTSCQIFDTQLPSKPLHTFDRLHYAAVGDVTWSPDGLSLFMCSQDGFCSLIKFDSFHELVQSNTPDDIVVFTPEQQNALMQVIRKHYPINMHNSLPTNATTLPNAAGNYSDAVLPPTSDSIMVSVLSMPTTVNVLPVKRKLKPPAFPALLESDKENVASEATLPTFALREDSSIVVIDDETGNLLSN